MNKLNVQAIFESIDGEVNGFDGAGQIATFIRLKGCNLRCNYCDTKYSQDSKPENWMTVDEVIEQVHTKKVTITGGEPLLQYKSLEPLLEKLLNDDCKISIETNGSKSIELWEYGNQYNWVWASENLRYIIDCKLISSGMSGYMSIERFDKLRDIDVIKFVIADEKDYEMACELVSLNTVNRDWKAKIVFSPAIVIQNLCGLSPDFVHVQVPVVDSRWPRQLAEMMIRDKIDAQFGLQIHKVLWPGVKEEK
jgi:7-carboxy-7-deazaguanine synthase